MPGEVRLNSSHTAIIISDSSVQAAEVSTLVSAPSHRSNPQPWTLMVIPSWMEPQHRQWVSRAARRSQERNGQFKRSRTPKKIYRRLRAGKRQNSQARYQSKKNRKLSRYRCIIYCLFLPWAVPPPGFVCFSWLSVLIWRNEALIMTKIWIMENRTQGEGVKRALSGAQKTKRRQEQDKYVKKLPTAGKLFLTHLTVKRIVQTIFF